MSARNLTPIGNEAQAALMQQRAHVLSEHHQLVLEGDAQREFLRHQKEIMNWHLEEVGGDRHLVHEEAKHFRVMNEVSEISTRPP